jgi:hypothetical protein
MQSAALGFGERKQLLYVYSHLFSVNDFPSGAQPSVPPRDFAPHSHPVSSPHTQRQDGPYGPSCPGATEMAT